MWNTNRYSFDGVVSSTAGAMVRVQGLMKVENSNGRRRGLDWAARDALTCFPWRRFRSEGSRITGYSLKPERLLGQPQWCVVKESSRPRNSRSVTRMSPEAKP